MKVSVVIPVLNGARFLRQSLDSVVAQTRPPDEIIVVDGGSTDGSADIARSYQGVRVIAQSGRTGFAGAYDEGFAAAVGDVVAPVDSDDWWTPEKTAIQLRVFDEQPETPYVIGKTRHFLEPGHPMPPGLRPEILDQDRMAPMPGTLMIRRSAFERVGPWGNGFTIAADIDWFARAKDILGPPATVDDVLLFKRFHDDNVTLFRARSLNSELLGLLRQSVSRQTEPRSP
jgi:glycosyltransferase involved in cell wall biosynthesis